MITLEIAIEQPALAEPFVISRQTFTHANILTVMLRDGEHCGHGECEPHESDAKASEVARRAIEDVVAALSSGAIDRDAIAHIMPAGPARNALDCALWDLEAKQAGRPAGALAGLSVPRPLETAFTLSIGTPTMMAAAAMRASGWRTLKIKLGRSDARGDLERLRAIRAARPDCRLIIDANGGWTKDHLDAITPDLAGLGVALIEQPLHPDAHDALIGYRGPVPLCADEACLDRSSLPQILGRYQFVNIKLDKTGGLTEALALSHAAQAAGLGVMVGCNVGTSLAMAPAMLVAQDAVFVDLDGPLLLGSDRDHALTYADGLIHPPMSALWG